MGKRKAEEISDDATLLPASSKEFTSLVTKYSFTSVKLEDLETQPSSSTPTISSTPSPPKLKHKSKTRVGSSGKSKNLAYAPPSTYSHIPTPDLDSLAKNLILVFIGLNPGSPILCSYL
jgi:hypothetical protein